MSSTKKTFWNFVDHLKGDKVVWMITLMLILVSIVCIFSSTSRLLDAGQTRLDIVRSQLMVVMGGLALIVLCYNIRSIRFFRWCSKWGFLVSFVLLALLLSKINTPVLKSIELNGARRILQIMGFQVHVFEVVKVAMALYLAWALDAFSRKELKYIKNPLWQKIVYIYAPFIVTMLMIIPGSNSAALLIGGIMFVIILLGGDNFRDMAILALAAVLLIAACFGVYKISDGKAMTRIGTGISRVFEDTDWEKQVLESRTGSKDYYDALDEIRQPYGAKIALKEGGFFGKGPGQSTQRYVVPDMSEDYMYSFIIEEYGVLGAIVIIFLYVSLLARASLIVRTCDGLYAKLAVAGLAILISGQAFLHMFVNADIGPMTGQTLPLISHGNSAFLCFSLAFGVILSISRISSNNLKKMQAAAEPILEIQETEAALSDLDAFESGEMKMEEDENL